MASEMFQTLMSVSTSYGKANKDFLAVNTANPNNNKFKHADKIAALKALGNLGLSIAV